MVIYIAGAGRVSHVGQAKNSRSRVHNEGSLAVIGNWPR